MTTPRDAIGLSERLRDRAAGTGYGGGDPLCAEAATQLDAQAAELASLRADNDKMHDLVDQLTQAHHDAEAKCDDLAQQLKDLRVVSNYNREQAEQSEARATRAEQERDKLQGMLLLCGELGGIGNNETPVTYLRRLIDGLIEAQQERDEAYERANQFSDHMDHIEGGLQLLLAATKADDPMKEIKWRVEEELRQIAIVRRRLASGPDKEGK